MTAPRERVASEVVVVGTNHRSGSVTLRDRIFVEEAAMPVFLSEVAQRGLDECLVLSTCDRVELHAATTQPGAGIAALQDVLVDRAAAPREETLGQLYAHRGAAAVRHIFSVAASLDSMVVGEPQVLGQVRASHATAAQAGTVGPILERTMQAAYAAAKRVRTETQIARGPVSIATSAVQVARDVHGTLAQHRCLVLGPGEMGELMLEQLRQAGLHDVTVAAATATRADAAARRLGGIGVTIAEIDQALPQADIVIADLGTGRPLLTAAAVEQALAARRRRPQFIIDAAIPGDVEATVADLDDVFLYNIDDLEAVAQEGRAGREAAATAAWAIVDEALDGFERDVRTRDAAPAIVRLQQHFEGVRDEILARGGDLDAAEATRMLVNRLLHDPFTTLRQAAADTNPDALAEAAMALFRLDNNKAGKRE